MSDETKGPVTKLGKYNFTAVPQIVGRWNGEVQAVQIGSPQILKWVWYLKISTSADNSTVNYRLNTTSVDGTTHRFELVLTPSADGMLIGRAPHDEHHSHCDIQVAENTPGKDMLTMTIINRATGKLERVCVFRLGHTVGGGAVLAVTNVLYSPEGFILSNESCVLRPCSPTDPVSYAMDEYASPTGKGGSNHTVKVEEADNN